MPLALASTTASTTSLRLATTKSVTWCLLACCHWLWACCHWQCGRLPTALTARLGPIVSTVRVKPRPLSLSHVPQATTARRGNRVRRLHQLKWATMRRQTLPRSSGALLARIRTPQPRPLAPAVHRGPSATPRASAATTRAIAATSAAMAQSTNLLVRLEHTMPAVRRLATAPHVQLVATAHRRPSPRYQDPVQLGICARVAHPPRSLHSSTTARSPSSPEATRPTRPDCLWDFVQRATIA